MIINAKIDEIIFADGYPDELSELMFLESNIVRRQFSLKPAEVKIMLGEYSGLEGED